MEKGKAAQGRNPERLRADNSRTVQGNYMTVEEQVMEVREKQAFWQGVVRGVIGSAVFFAGLVTLIYYIVQIVDALK